MAAALTALSLESRSTNKTQAGGRLALYSVRQNRQQKGPRAQVYIAAWGPGRVRVYELWYGDSMEQHRFQAGVSREQRAFEELIRAKGAMVLPDLAQVRGEGLFKPFCGMRCPSCPPCKLGKCGGLCIVSCTGVALPKGRVARACLQWAAGLPEGT